MIEFELKMRGSGGISHVTVDLVPVTYFPDDRHFVSHQSSTTTGTESWDVLCVVMFGHQMGQISSELDNFGTFSHQISVDFGTVKSDQKKSRGCPICGVNLTHFEPRSDIHD